MTYTIIACPNDPFAAAAAGRRSGRRRVPVGRRAHHRRQRAVRRGQPQHLAADAEPATVPASAASGVPRAADDRAARGRVHGRHLSRSVRQPARRVRSRDAAHARHQGRRGDRADPRRSSGCSTGPSASTTRRCPTRCPLIDTLRTLPRPRRQRPSMPVGRAETIDPAPATPFEVVPAWTSIWIEPARGDAEPFETTVIDPDTHQRRAVHGRARDAALPLLRDRRDRSSPARTSSEPQTRRSSPRARSTSNRSTRLPTRDQIATDADGQAVVTIWIVVRDDRGGESWRAQLGHAAWSRPASVGGMLGGMWSSAKPKMPGPGEALPGRAEKMPVPRQALRERRAAGAAVPRGHRAGDVRPRLLLGRGEEVLAAAGRLQHRGRLRGRDDAEPDLPRGLLGPDRAHRGGAGGVRSRSVVSYGELLRVVLGGARPDAGHASGQRRRHAVPLGDLHARRRAARGGDRLARRVRARARRTPASRRSRPRSRPRRSSSTPRTTTSSTWRRTPTATAAWAAPACRARGRRHRRRRHASRR